MLYHCSTFFPTNQSGLLCHTLNTAEANVFSSTAARIAVQRRLSAAVTFLTPPARCSTSSAGQDIHSRLSDIHPPPGRRMVNAAPGAALQ
jgi:hypothetical protein